ncbi:YqaA family protein [Alistipes ihumii]|uniref:YqaA family protein n=1 Tax=Alistipes ihumii TaxID=1470347 RepID=UPI003AB290B2
MEALLDWGYIGLFVGSFVAATVVPFSSDVLLVGMLAAGGNVWLSVLVATVGNWAGGLTSYWIGWIGRWEWIEKYLRVKHETLERHKSKVDRFGAWLALLTWLPFFGDVFAVALGFYRVNFRKSTVLMLVGKGARFVCWALLFIWGKDLWG